MDTIYQGAYVQKPHVTIIYQDDKITISSDKWCLFGMRSAPQVRNFDQVRNLVYGSGPKVVFINDATYVTKDFDMSEDFWQLYPKIMCEYPMSISTPLYVVEETMPPLEPILL